MTDRIWDVCSQIETMAADGIVFAVEDQAGAYEAARKRRQTNGAAVYVREVVGAVRAFAYLHRPYGAQLVIVTPLEVRKSLGLPAGASKAQIKRMVSSVIGEPTKSMSEHAADAAAIAIAADKKLRAESLLQTLRARAKAKARRTAGD